MRHLVLLFALVLPAAAQDLAAKLDTHVRAYADQGKFNGAVLVAKDGKPVLAKGYGLANAEWNIPNSPSTKFRLGSITKQFTAMLVLKLEQQGKWKVEDPLSKYLPDAPAAWEKITLHHLLSHTAGIPNFTSFPDYRKTMMLPSPPPQSLERFRGKPLEFEPGEKWAYSNSGYVLLGLLLEKVSGKTYAQLLRELITEPLGMKDTGYDIPDAVLKNRASGYAPAGEVWRNAEFLDMTIPHGAGAMYSTVEDMLLWDQALNTEKLLPKATMEKMVTPVKNNYAYGWAVQERDGHKEIGHGGGINGFTTQFSRYPADGLTVVVLANLEGSRSGQIAGALAQIAFGREILAPKARVEAKIDPVLFDAYAGNYELAPGFVLKFWREGDRFFTQATGQPSARIFAESDNRFFLQVVEAQVEFLRGSDGKVTHLVLEQGGRKQEAKRLP